MKIRSFALLSAIILCHGCGIFTKSKQQPEETAVSKKPTAKEFTITEDEGDKNTYRGSRTRQVDILHTKLDVRPDWNKEVLYGKAWITFRPYWYSTDSLTLDAKGFDIKEVYLDGSNGLQALTYKYDSLQMHIFLGKEYSRKDTLTISITYTAKPNELKDHQGSAAISDAKGLYFINADGKDKNKPKQIWTQGETESNSCWFPTYDSPNERMTQEISITVDTQYVTLSNGLLTASTRNNDGTRTDTWRQTLPAAPYLTMFAAGKFALVKDHWRNIDVNYYVEENYERYAKSIFGHTPEMLEFFSTKLGVDYPWEKFSQIVVRDYISGAMENTTCVLHGQYLQRTDRELLDETNEDVISHELFHHWFGDLVTCESWSNIPLNESFATYGEYLWNEYKYGLDEADMRFQHELTNYLAMVNQKDPDVIRYHYGDKEQMFDGVSYAKGSRILHMLRKVVGDDAFFASLKLYLNTNRFGSVEIHNLRLTFEQVTGQDMNWFFNEWFLNHGYANFDITYRYDGAKEIMTVEQRQDLENNPLYRMPVMVDIYINGKVEHHQIVISKKKEDFEFPVSAEPDFVNFDAQKMLLCRKSDDHTQKEWAFIYHHGPLYMDRYEAMNKLCKRYDGNGDTTVLNVIENGLQDVNTNIRGMAVKNSYHVANDSPDKTKKDLIKTKLLHMAQHDLKSSVRVDAIKALNSNFDDSTLYPLYRKIANEDQSYSVDEEALLVLNERNKTMAFALAKELEKDSGGAVINGIASIYADQGSDAENGFFMRMFSKAHGMERFSLLTDYSRFLSRCKDSTISSGAKMMEDVARNGSPWWVKMAAMQALSSVEDIYGERERKANTEAEELKKTNTDPSKVADKEKEAAAYKILKQTITDLMKEIKKQETDKNLTKIYRSGE